ncbi:polyubiquitin-binding protein UFD1 [Ascoidea rubescens DSM 1968]|uniref:UFD1-domain-containing protein n=1 Tax=Ascoidea rubescens DSM 1968 TaxID=1344418 RepID=A0A1D2VJK1_9ASCO|nr:UFD1-domain-containing protein [Ascoidea rubescens DSM 1968]ODV61750.1 UFD1-domain-containing protein [Ascoidea rubescens DSM 1968]
MMPDSSRKDSANYGGKIFLPSSALDKLTRLKIRYPMLFELHNEETNSKTHSGVLEFTAEEGRVYIPYWMMLTLNIEAGSLIKISSLSDLPLGSFVKLEPQSVDFLDISNPKAVLETALRNFSTLTVNDIIEFNYNDNIFKVKVLEVKPKSSYNGICVIETDLQTDFAPPVGYVEPDYKALQKQKNSRNNNSLNNPNRNVMSKKLNYASMLKEPSNGSSNPNLHKFEGQGHKLSNKRARNSRSRRISSSNTNQNKKSDNSKDANFVDLDNLQLDDVPSPLRLPVGQLFFGFAKNAVIQKSES